MSKEQPANLRKVSAWRWWYRGCLITFVFGAAGVCILSSIGMVTVFRSALG
ncbi:MAG: hypothetical protein IAE80_04820 [Anaerolinea sp.]|nr:hypothetical protein [Anaerolinea sp.]